MAPPRIINDDRQDQIIQNAIDGHRPLLLTHQSSEGWRAFKGRFVAGSRSTHAIVVRIAWPENGGSTRLPAPGDPLGATFRFDHKKCLFATTLEEMQRQTQEALVRLRWPNHIRQIQRRAFERARSPTGTIIAVRFWQNDGPGRSDTLARNIRHGQLEDLSASGMRLKATRSEEFEIGRTYRCVFTPRSGKPSIVVDAILQHRESTEYGRACLGFQFVGLEATKEGQDVLNRLVRLTHRFRSGRSRSRG